MLSFRLLLPLAVSSALLPLSLPPARAQEPLAAATAPSAVLYQRAPGVPAALRVGWERPASIPSSRVLGYVLWRGDEHGVFGPTGGTQCDRPRQLLETSQAAPTFRFYDGAPGGPAGKLVEFPSQPPESGGTYRYQVATAYRVSSRTTRMSPLSGSSSFVTFLVPPVVIDVYGQSGPEVQVDVRSFDLTWLQVPAADTYTVVVSAAPTLRLTPQKWTFRAVPVDQGGPPTLTETLQVTRQDLLSKERLYLAVGARNSQDGVAPKPLGAVYSEIVTLTPKTTEGP